jgi:hypothetical protein
MFSPLADVGLGPFQCDARQVSERLVGLHAREVFLHKLVALWLFPLSDFGRFLDGKPIDALKPDVVGVVVNVECLVFALPHFVLPCSLLVFFIADQAISICYTELRTGTVEEG